MRTCEMCNQIQRHKGKILSFHQLLDGIWLIFQHIFKSMQKRLKALIVLPLTALQGISWSQWCSLSWPDLNPTKDLNKANILFHVDRDQLQNKLSHFFRPWSKCHINPHNIRTKAQTQNKEILMEGGGITVVRSVVHDIANTERLLSKCFSQDPPHKRTSSEQTHHPVKRFSAFKKKEAEDLAVQFSKHRVEKSNTLGCVPFSLPMSSIIGFRGCHATVSLGMTLFAAKISARMRKTVEHAEVKWWAEAAALV